MNNVISHTEGIDRPIQSAQTLLYNRLQLKWGDMGLTGDKFQMYGRTYRNYRSEGYVPEWFKAGKDYSGDLFFDDKLAALMWFAVHDDVKVTKQTAHTYKVSLYGFVNLTQLKPDNTTQRMDEAVVNDVVKMLQPSLYGFTITAIQRDVDAVLSKYSGMAKKSSLNRDMQPYYCFRIDMENMLSLDYCGDRTPNYPLYQNAMVVPYKILFKDSPDTTVKQTLINGVQAQLEFPTGASVTVPYLSGKYILTPQTLNYQLVELPYTLVSGRIGNNGDNTFADGDTLIVSVNVN